MNSLERLPSETHKPITGYLGRAGRAHLSLPFADSRHCAGRHDGRRVHRRVWGIAALTLTGLFVLSVTRLLRAFKDRS
jgi:mercuric ion transport protein